MLRPCVRSAQATSRRAKVSELGMALLVQDNVVRFQVPVDYVMLRLWLGPIITSSFIRPDAKTVDLERVVWLLPHRICDCACASLQRHSNRPHYKTRQGTRVCSSSNDEREIHLSVRTSNFC